MDINIGLSFTATGTSDALIGTPSILPSSLTDNLKYFVRTTLPNQTTTPTLDVNSLGAYTITARGGQPLLPNDIPGGGFIAIFQYDLTNTRWELLNPNASEQTAAAVYMFSGTNSDIAGYESAPALELYSAGVLQDPTIAVTIAETLMEEFATDLGYPNTTVIPIGTIQAHYETQKLAGSNNYYSYFKLYSRTSGGVETLLLTSDNSSQAAVNTIIQNTVSAFNSSPITLTSTDRIIVKVYCRMVSSSANIKILYDNNTNARLELPVSLSYLPQIVSQTITNGVTNKAPSEDVVYDALALKLTSSNNLSDLSNATTARTNLGVAIGSNVQAWDSDLDSIAGLSPSNDDFIQRKSGAWTNRTIAQVRTDLNVTAQYFWNSAATTTIADSTSYRIAALFGVVLGTTDSLNNQVSSEYTGTIKSARINWNCVAGSNEGTTFTIKNLTTGLTWDASTSLDFSAGTGSQNFTGGTLAVSVGDKLQAILTTPVYATNPSSLSIGASISIYL